MKIPIVFLPTAKAQTPSERGAKFECHKVTPLGLHVQETIAHDLHIASYDHSLEDHMDVQ